jgi:hypothetical protein
MRAENFSETGAQIKNVSHVLKGIKEWKPTHRHITANNAH